MAASSATSAIQKSLSIELANAGASAGRPAGVSVPPA